MWALNCNLRIITGCLQPTPVEQLPVLAGIPPAELHRQAASLALARHAMDPDHLLHHTITREEMQPRLKSWCPFATSRPSVNRPTQWDKGSLDSYDVVSEVATVHQQAAWIYCLTSKCCPGSDIPRQAWVKLNRLCAGIGRFNADMWRLGLSKSAACDCGADQQTANHIITECPPIVQQMVSMAWLLLMQMQQLLSGFSASSQRSNYFFWFFWFHTQEDDTYTVQIASTKLILNICRETSTKVFLARILC